MGLYNTVSFDESLPPSFENDGFSLTPEMIEKYERTKIKVMNGQIRGDRDYFCRNASIFDVTGTKICWGDVTPKDLEEMLGVYYLMTEHKSFWRVDPNVMNEAIESDDPNSRSPFRKYLPLEPVALEIKYVKRNAIARIVDGKIQTNERLISDNYQ